jgi:enterochelin esterase-like enzyme
MGGREALFIGISMPEAFSYIGAFSPAPELLATSYYEAFVNNGVELVYYVTRGGHDFVAD